ncbi:MAG: PEGA domain-containing protein, partial [Spirochaetota bacterium]
AGEAAEVLLGRRYATLEVVTGDPDAAVAVDGILRGFDSVRASFLRAGTHRILVGASGRPSVAREVELAAGEVRVERVELPATTARTVRIQSSPAGANVYVDSVWIGTTPIEYDFPVEDGIFATSTIVRLRRDNYLESRFVVDAASPPVVNRALLPASIDWSEEIRDRRDGFYSALTWFVVSVPVTLVLNGGYESVRGAFPPAGSEELSPEELRRLVRLGNIFYWSSIGGALVNVGLFVNLLISIFDYIEVGEGSHNQ